jgi:Flp pilus assembly protein TadG
MSDIALCSTFGRNSRRRQRGAFATAFVVMALLLMFFVGFGLDFGRIFVSRTELQNSADACALAGAKSLTGAGAQLTVAEAWGITAGKLNLVGMQAIAPTIVADSQMTFSATLNGAYATKSAVTAAGTASSIRFVKCTLRETNVSPFVIKIANLITPASVTATTVTAMAVASLAPSSTTCAIPLATCAAPGTNAATIPPFGLNVGQWYQGKLDPGSANTGSFKWINFPGFSTVPQMAAMIRGNGTCNVSAGTTTVNGQSGNIASLLDDWNEHFGLYKGSSIGSVPDFTGYWYPSTWANSSGVVQGSAYSDFLMRRAAGAAPQALNPGGWKSTGWATTPKSDRRLVVSPIVDCTALPGGGTTAILGWACQLMLNPVANGNDGMFLEYRGLASDLGSPCAVAGTPGGSTGTGPLVPTLIQ